MDAWVVHRNEGRGVLLLSEAGIYTTLSAAAFKVTICDLKEAVSNRNRDTGGKRPATRYLCREADAAGL